MSGLQGKEIPGFYWDDGKRKYFKIQKNHVASPSSPYTQEKVLKMRRQSKKDNADAARDTANRSQRVQRSELLSKSSLTGLVLSRETNYASAKAQIHDLQAHAYGRGFCSAEVFHHSRSLIDSFIWHRELKGILVGSDKLDLGLGNPNISFISVGARKRKTFLERVSSTVSSFSLTPSGILCYTTLGIDDSANVDFMRLHNPSNRSQRPEITTPRISFNIGGSAFASAANPFREDHDLIAVGASGYALLTTYCPASNFSDAERLDLVGDVLAAEWLDANTVALGHRSGRIVLWDIRSGGKSSRLWHPSCINDMKRVDVNKLVVGGLQDQLAMYDLRMPVITDLSFMNSNKRKRTKDTSSTSLPIVCYEYSNRYQKLGLDLDNENGILATGDDKGFVNIFSTHTGERINRFKPLDQTVEDQPHRGPFDITHLAFCKSEDDEDFLLGCSGRFIWASKWSKGPMDNRLSLKSALGEQYYVR